MTIYVANFDLQIKDDELRDLFTTYGEVQSANVEMDVFTDKSRGFGYVEMPDEEQAKTAIAGLNDSTFKGRVITVQQAEPKEIRRGSYKVGDGGVNPYRFRKN
jgi:RNA recognition motif-containing protein